MTSKISQIDGQKGDGFTCDSDLLLSQTVKRKSRFRHAKFYATICILGVAALTASPANAGAKCYECPDGTMVESAKDCPDPAFLAVDMKPHQSLPLRRVKTINLADKIDTDSLNAAELAAWQDFERQVQQDPQVSYQAAIEMWSSNYSDSLQRMAIYRARLLVRSTEEIENLSFLLSCLEDSEAQREKCLKLGKGNGLEKKLAARRLSLLASNPKFASQ